MPKSSTPAKVRTRTIIEKEEQQKESNPIPGMIRDYLVNQNMEVEDELKQYQYVIHASKYNREGKAVPITDRVYEDLLQLPYELGARFGSSRFRLMIQVYDGEEKKAFVRIQDYELEWAGSDEPADEEYGDPGAAREDLAGDQMKLILQRERQQHELQLKQMEMNNQIVIAALQAKSGGGQSMRPDDFIKLLKTGISLGQGAQIPLAGYDENAPEEEKQGFIEELMSGPWGGVLAGIVERILSGNRGTAPVGDIMGEPSPPVTQATHSRQLQQTSDRPSVIPQPLPREEQPQTLSAPLHEHTT